MFSLILMLYELDHPYICPLGKRVMHKLKLSIMFATLEQLTAELLIILQVYPFIFGDFSLPSIVFIFIFMNM